VVKAPTKKTKETNWPDAAGPPPVGPEDRESTKKTKETNDRGVVSGTGEGFEGQDARVQEWQPFMH
jgi:hypothetical protein